MANEPIVTVLGNLVDDPELRFTPSGKAVTNFRLASTPRVKDGDDWKDGETLWLGCSVWGTPAENVAESLTRGMNVIVQGRLKSRAWEDKDGNKRTSLELDVDAVGPTLQWQTAKVTKAGRQGGGQPQAQRSRGAQQQAADPWARPSAPVSDPWAAPGVGSDEPPF